MPASRPSIPDRKRLDSDVRALMRQPSTPWITFDRDSRVAQGESPAPLVLPVARSSILAGEGVFPQPTEPPQPASEPSNLVVASDLAASEQPPSEEAYDVLPLAGYPRRAVWAVVAGAATLALVGIAASALHGTKASKVAAAAATATAAPARTVMDDIPPPDLADVPTTTPATAPDAKPAATAASTPRYPDSDPRSKLGHLAIRGGASWQLVFLDGKRLLGRGARAFDVMCGAHTIAIGDRKDAHPVDVPCMGEFVVSK